MDAVEIAEGLFGSFGVIERGSFPAGKADGNAPDVQGDVELGRNFKDEVFRAGFFGSLDGDDGMARVD